MLKYDIHFRLDGETLRKLRTLANTQQRTISNLIRWLICQEFSRQGLDSNEENDIPVASDTGISHLSYEDKGQRG